MTDTAPTPLKFLDQALSVLRNLGLIKSEPAPAPIVALIDRIAYLEPEKAAAIARTLSQASLFNEVVREQIQAMQIAERYRQITAAFDSIRDDAKNMVEQMKDNRIDTFERLSNVSHAQPRAARGVAGSRDCLIARSVGCCVELGGTYRCRYCTTTVSFTERLK